MADEKKSFLSQIPLWNKDQVFCICRKIYNISNETGIMNVIIIAALTSSHRLHIRYTYLYAITVLTLDFTASFLFYP